MSISKPPWADQTNQPEDFISSEIIQKKEETKKKIPNKILKPNDKRNNNVLDASKNSSGESFLLLIYFLGIPKKTAIEILQYQPPGYAYNPLLILLYLSFGRKARQTISKDLSMPTGRIYPILSDMEKRGIITQFKHSVKRMTFYYTQYDYEISKSGRIILDRLIKYLNTSNHVRVSGNYWDQSRK